MKKILSLLAALTLLTTSCDDKLDIVPLGKTTLSTVEDIETLLNQEWRIYGSEFDLDYIVGLTTPQWKSIGEIAQQKQELEYPYVFCDESIDRADLTETDYRYQNIYQYINYMNVVISKLPDADGDATCKPQLDAEARVLRAWLHFLLVNIYAAQYDESTAGQLGGIAYVDNTNHSEQKTKLTIAEVYDRILEDCSDEVIGRLSAKITNDPCRIDVDFGYAVRARVLFQMKRYDEALKYANAAIAANPTIEDRSHVMSTGEWDCQKNSPNFYVFMTWSNIVNFSELTGCLLTPATVALYEPGDYVRDYSDDGIWYDSATLGSYGVENSEMYYGTAARVNVYGIKAEQMYYVAAECLIRQGKYSEGLAMVDRVRKNRISSDFFTAFADRNITNEAEAMKLLIDAKTIEMLGCYETFFDCKRRNTEAAYRADIVHDLNDYGTHTLKPDSPLWILPFPQNAVKFNSSLTQNY